MPLDVMNEVAATAAATGTATASDGVAADGSTTAATGAAGSDELAAPSKRELVESRKEQRETNRLLGLLLAQRSDGQARATVKEPAAQGSATTAVKWEAGDQLAFRDAIEEAELKLSVKQRQMLEKLYQTDRGTVTDPVAWVRDNAETLGWRKPPGGSAAPPPVVTGTPTKLDAGAPTGTAAGTTTLPDDPALLTQSVIDRMTPQEAAAHLRRWNDSQKGFRHPFQAAREAERGVGNDLAKTAEALRRVLSGK